MDDLFQRPLGPISITLNFWWKLTSNSFHQKTIWEVFKKIEDVQETSVPMSCRMFAACFRVKQFDMILKLVQIQYDRNSYNSYDFQTCLDLFRINDYDTNWYNS